MNDVERCISEWVDLVNERDATIAALQAQLESANKLIHKKTCDLGRAETIVNDLQSQLTQRTAELERVRGELAETKEEVKCLDEQVLAMNEWGLTVEKLLLALPKVDGEIYEAVASYRYDKAPEAWFHCESQLIALLQHRQGMEG